VTARDERTWPGAQMIMALAGLREPIIVVLFLIAFFTAISGKPLDGVLLLLVATGLAWDAAVRCRGHAAGGGGSAAVPACAAVKDHDPQPPPRTGAHPAGGRDRGPHHTAAVTRRPRRPALTRRLLAGLAGGACYAVVVGSFSRYSWPATVGVIALGAAVVAVGWRGPLRRRPDPGPLPLPGAMLWAGVLVAGSAWELASLLQQPDLTTDSYAHPTISALTDPLFGSHGGRSVALAAWLVAGWLLARR
jgi:hypothetical protein